MSIRLLSSLALLLALAAPADARSKAAAFLVKEQIASACEGGRGSIDPADVIERDLDGDGRDDLIIAHDAVTCTSGGQFGRSAFCGMQVCSVNFYLRRGPLLQISHEMLGGGVTVGGGPGSSHIDGCSWRQPGRCPMERP
ncbi:hypothetical protein VQ045_11165 [Aurantimonas sp. E1-2-R+4]|uniref:hypothetical protein n=1 Tax=Aurantimonas sp. E1-2-R+4 TaxID=3113714 RepID=UPI002F95E1CB